MQTKYHADLAPRHTLACPSLARELVLIAVSYTHLTLPTSDLV